MSFSCQKGEFDRFFNLLDRPVEESRPDRQPDRPVDPTGFHLWCVGPHKTTQSTNPLSEDFEPNYINLLRKKIGTQRAKSKQTLQQLRSAMRMIAKYKLTCAMFESSSCQ